MMLHTDPALKRLFCSSYDVHIKKGEVLAVHKAGLTALHIWRIRATLSAFITNRQR